MERGTRSLKNRIVTKKNGILNIETNIMIMVMSPKTVKLPIRWCMKYFKKVIYNHFQCDAVTNKDIMVTCCVIYLTWFFKVKLWSLIWVIRSYILKWWSLFVTYGHFSISKLRLCLKSEERMEEKEITGITMNYKPSPSKTI